MACKSLGWACAAILIGSTVANAQVDLEKMLGSLSFSGEDPPSVADEMPAPPGTAAATMQPPRAVEPQPAERPAPDGAAAGLLNSGPIGGSGLDDYWQSSAPATRLAPRGDRPPAPVLEPHAEPANNGVVQQPLTGRTMVGRRVDLDRLVGEPVPAAENRPAAPIESHWPAEPGFAGYAANVPCHTAQGVSGGPIHAVKHLRPTPYLAVPNLPPPATVDNYYRTPACYRDLWGGYAQERAHHCQKWHKHLHGHCRCLNPETCACAIPRQPVAAEPQLPCPSMEAEQPACAVVPPVTQQR